MRTKSEKKGKKGVQSYGSFKEILNKQNQLMDLVQKKEQDFTQVDYSSLNEFQSHNGMRLRYSMQNLQQNVAQSTKTINVNHKYYKLLNQNQYDNIHEEIHVHEELDRSEDEIPHDKKVKKFVGDEAI